jgi:hypothetical protein
VTIAPDNHDHHSDDHAITSVWSSYGHTFLEEDGYEACLICGAVYQLVPDDPKRPVAGRYCAADGDDPVPCTGDTSLVHGYPGERGDGLFDHACNCVRCA